MTGGFGRRSPRRADLAEHHHRIAVVVENLERADALATGRETLGRGHRGKRLPRTVAGIPTARLRTRLTAMACRRGIGVIGADPAYTSPWGAPRLAKTSATTGFRPATATTHHGAAAAVGRRGLGMATKRRLAGPRQRTGPDTNLRRPAHQPDTTTVP